MNDLCKLEEERLKEQNPQGFRFDPTDRELVKYYLKPRVLNKPLPELSFMEVDLYNQNPDTLAGSYSLKIPFLFLVFCWLFWIEWKIITFNALVWYIYIYIFIYIIGLKSNERVKGYDILCSNYWIKLVISYVTLHNPLLLLLKLLRVW